jgi:hypothetical protein
VTGGPDDALVLDRTRRWVQSFVIALGLCPFARRVVDDGLLRYAVSAARDEAALLADLERELHALSATPPAQVETTLLIHPHVFGDFLAYNDFLGVVEERLDEWQLTGSVQVASFHPRYQFAGTSADAVENCTNRSPYPMLHLLREASVTAVADDPDELLRIPERNIAALRALGLAEVRQRLAAIATGRD